MIRDVVNEAPVSCERLWGHRRVFECERELMRKRCRIAFEECSDGEWPLYLAEYGSDLVS